MPIVILGSGRCGTSMIARMLNICGLNIGSHDDVYSADENNPKGYWEHRGMVSINEEILQHYGGSSIVAPTLCPGWENDKWLDPLIDRAKAIAGEIAKSGSEWGWKDPKAGWTIPFWKRAIPGLKIVVCFRNPVDVVSSYDNYYNNQGVLLYKRASLQGFALWESIHASVIDSTTSDERLFTQYESYFPDYFPALGELLKFVGLADLEKCSTIDRRLMAFHDPALKHHSTSLEHMLRESRVPSSAKLLYLKMVSGDGFVYERQENAQALVPAIVSNYSKPPERCDYETVEKIERLNVKLLARNRQLESILASRTHQIASMICEVLIATDRVKKQIVNVAISDVFSPSPRSEKQSSGLKLVH